MSTEVKAAAAEVAVKEPSEPLFSKKNKRLLTDPLNDSNPITVQVLGICSALAITVQVKQAVVMSLSVLAVMIGASLVILVDQVLKAYVYDVSKALSVFVGLIITNCIIMGRLEAFALANKPWPSILDAIGNAAGYGWILIAVAVVRELFGSGTLMGFTIIPESVFGFGYMNNNMMILPPMALITVGIIIWIQRSKNTAVFLDR
jgi:Na+-transporting NADH:ubiquinone oxidoreductase subunit D